MTTIKAADVDRFIARPDPSKPVVLLYGPDAGLVRERTETLVRASVDDPDDPFSFVRIEADDLSANPARLVEEAHTVPLFGGRRAVLVKAGTRNIAAAVEAVVAQPSDDCRIIIEAGDLRRNAPLRVLCEKAKSAIALPCYADNDSALGRLIDEEMRAAKLTIAPDARAALQASLGGDRLASRNEIRKLVLYAADAGRIELADVMAVVSDASGVALDAVVDAAFAGRTAEMDDEFAKARAGGSSPGAILSAALRQVASLYRMRLAVDDGEGADLVAARAVHFSRKDMVAGALRAWSAERLETAMQQLAAAALEARQHSGLADAIARRALLSVAVGFRRNA